MKPAFVFCVFPPETPPAAVMAGELAEFFARRGDAVTVIAPFPSRPQGRIYDGYRRSWRLDEIYQHARVRRVPCATIGRRRSGVRRILENVTFGFTSAVALALVPRPDVVVVEAWPVLASLMVLTVCAMRSVPSIYYIQDLYPEAMVSAGLIRADGLAAKALLLLDRLACRTASTNVVISPSMAAYVGVTRRVSADRVDVIPNWLDLSTMHPGNDGSQWRRAVGIGDSDFVALFAGTVGHASGAGVLTEVARLLADTPRIRIVCVGEGPLKQEIEAQERRERLTNLMLLPFQPRDRVAAMHAGADVCLLTTAPGMGVSSVPSKLITYLAMARPVIASVPAESDVARMIEDERLGWLVRPGNAQSLAGAIRRAAALPVGERRAMGARARRVAEERHSTQSAVERFSALFDALTNKRQEAPTTKSRAAV